jgi:hypothetical protein
MQRHLLRICYGVDANGAVPVVARAERARGRARCDVQRGDATPYMDAVRQGAPAAAAIGTRESVVRWIETPPMARRKARRVFPTLLDIQLPFPLESCAYTFLELPGQRGRAPAALGVAARHRDVRQRMERLADDGIDPWVLDHEGVALCSQWVREGAAASRANTAWALVYACGERSVLVIGRARRYLGAYGIGLDDPARTARHVRAHVSEGEPVEWVWCGPDLAPGDADRGGGWAAAREAFLSAVPGHCREVEQPDAFLARALAVRAVTPDAYGLNLRAGELAHARSVRAAASRGRRAAACWCAAGVLLCALGLASDALLSRRLAAADRLVGGAVDELAGYHVTARGTDALRVVQDRVGDQVAALRPLRRAFEPSLLNLVTAIRDAGRRHRLRLSELSVSARELRVVGLADEWNACDAAGRAAEQAGYTVRIDRESLLAEEAVKFTIQGERGP